MRGAKGPGGTSILSPGFDILVKTSGDQRSAVVDLRVTYTRRPVASCNKTFLTTLYLFAGMTPCATAHTTIPFHSANGRSPYEMRGAKGPGGTSILSPGFDILVKTWTSKIRSSGSSCNIHATSYRVLKQYLSNNAFSFCWEQILGERPREERRMLLHVTRLARPFDNVDAPAKRKSPATTYSPTIRQYHRRKRA